MSPSSVVEGLKSYVSSEILDGEDIGLEASTPLIEWGIVNSMEIARLVAFIQDRWGVAIPGDMITLEHFKDLYSISRLIVEEDGR